MQGYMKICLRVDYIQNLENNQCYFYKQNLIGKDLLLSKLFLLL